LTNDNVVAMTGTHYKLHTTRYTLHTTHIVYVTFMMNTIHHITINIRSA